MVHFLRSIAVAQLTFCSIHGLSITAFSTQLFTWMERSTWAFWLPSFKICFLSSHGSSQRGKFPVFSYSFDRLFTWLRFMAQWKLWWGGVTWQWLLTCAFYCGTTLKLWPKIVLSLEIKLLLEFDLVNKGFDILSRRLICVCILRQGKYWIWHLNWTLQF